MAERFIPLSFFITV